MAARWWRRRRPDREADRAAVGDLAATTPAGPLTRRAQIALLAVSFAALVLASITGVQRQGDSARLAAYIRCQVSVNEATAMATRARTEAAEVDQAADQAESAATRTLILTVFTATGPDPREQVRAAFVAYDRALREIQTRRAEAEQQRITHPLPPLPSETCRGVDQ